MNTQNSMKNVVGEVQLSFKKYNSINASRISTSKDANAVFRELFPPNQISYREHFYVLYLNNSNHIMGYQLLSIGGITNTIVDIRIVLQGALLTTAVGIILAHNHPSGNTKPSISDRELTDKIDKACKTLDIQLLDHLIITEESYFSFADNGEL